ncbi:hypothetical protein [Desulfobulbus alkaliphilus]|uniref:hypothetical protein n=1 Tax=Desulfobulbus alkaliphilus TaxID=869814 RepID=UPI001965C793|nr:hypothetical protein [Desulfobulbus alkaliphilus]MBM9538576.1 hypothetical protein [Desulfobulbus alkaliphilus]
MKNILRELIKRTPLYPVLRTFEQRREVNEWVRRGRPAPPPHIIKQRTIREFAEKFGVNVLIETGTYYGDMVEAMKGYFSRIYSIELSKELYEKANRKFAGDNRISIIYGDSGIELGELISNLHEPALFWLDGHYSAGVTAKGDKDTPIYEELKHIFSSSQKGHVIIIDDARCFGRDPAYPSINELSEFIKSNISNVKIEVKDDSIRVFPDCQVG